MLWYGVCLALSVMSTERHILVKWLETVGSNLLFHVFVFTLVHIGEIQNIVCWVTVLYHKTNIYFFI